jgi:hypothetical protein
LLDADALHFFQDADAVYAIDDQDGVAWTKNHFPEAPAVVGEEIHGDLAALNDKHLLKIADRPLERRMIVRILLEPCVVGKQTELKGGCIRRKKSRFLDRGVRPDDLAVTASVMFDNFKSQAITLPAKFRALK